MNQEQFKGSLLILLTVSVEFSIMLPAEDPSYDFVAFVESGNTLLEAQAGPIGESHVY